MSEMTRRAVLVGTCCAGAAAVLGGCAAKSEQAAPTGPPKKSDIPVGGGVIYPHGSSSDPHGVVVTQPTAGDFRAFSARCTHQHCAVTRVEDGVIKCPCHGSWYSISDGTVKAGPDGHNIPLPDMIKSGNVTFNGDEIVIVYPS